MSFLSSGPGLALARFPDVANSESNAWIRSCRTFSVYLPVPPWNRQPEAGVDWQAIARLAEDMRFPVTGATRPLSEGVTTGRGPVVHPDNVKSLL